MNIVWSPLALERIDEYADYIIYRVGACVSVLTVRHGAQLLSEADLEEDR